MSENSGIEWTHHTFNPWWGCTRVSPGCQHCYAETFAKRYGYGWGPQAERRMFGEKHWSEPLKWNAKAAAAGERHRVFCASMADVFEDRPELAVERARLFALIRETPSLDWLLLTKRPENADHLWRAALIDSFNGADSLGPLWDENVWLGVTAEDQQRADERIPHLLATPAAKHFVSYEPALGTVDFRRCLVYAFDSPDATRQTRIDWVIVGGESGPGARPFDIAWARSTVAQCKAAGVAVFVKQLGAQCIDEAHSGIGAEIWQWPSGTRAHVGKSMESPRWIQFRHSKGGDWNEWPEDVRVREFPR